MEEASEEDDMAEVVAILFFSCALFVFTLCTWGRTGPIVFNPHALK